jgi:hypothetical protein
MKQRPCVRCGSRPRGDDLFVCLTCADDPTKLDEMRQAEEATRDLPYNSGERGRAQRAYLVKTFHWNGHWSQRG